MKILQLGPYPPPHGGVQTNIAAIRSFLLEHGVPCAVINTTRHRKRRENGIFYPRTACGLLWLLMRLNYDVIHLHFGGQLTWRLVCLAFVCSLLPRVRTVLTFHSGGYPESQAGKRLTRRSIAAFVLRRLDCLIGVNRELIDFYLRLGVPAERTRLIEPHAVAESRIADALSPELEAFIDSHQPTLCAVGLLEPEYELHLQIEVIQDVIEKHPRAGLLIIGSGSLETELRGFIRNKSYSDHVMLAGDVPHAQTLLAMERSSILLRTTLYDGDSISVREALHLGVPVIATDNGMRPEGVVLVPRRDKPALLNAVEKRLAAGAGFVRGDEAGSRNLQAVLDVYRELVP